MKKMKFLLSLTLLAALFLAACGGGGATEGTPGVDLTGEPTLGSALGTPTVGTGIELTPTVGLETSTESVDTTPTAAMTETVATLEATGTPQAGTGMEQGQFVLLSDLLQYQANAADGSQLGTIAGVVVNRPIPATGSSTGTGTGSDTLTSTETPSADLTPTVESSTGSGTGTETMTSAGPTITYLVLDTSSASTSGASTGSDTSTTAATATPEVGLTPTTDTSTGSGSGNSGSSTATGSEILVPWAAVSTSAASTTGDTTAGATTGEKALTLNITAEDLASAPTFDSAMDTSVAQPGWDSAITSYWSGTGLSIPATGAGTTEAGSAIVMRSPLQSMSVNDSSGKSFGKVADYVVDMQTGELKYAVLSSSDTAQGKYYLVPLSHFTWSSGVTGGFNANFAGTSLSSAPSFTSLDNIDFSNIGEVDTYWQSQGTGVQ